MFACLTFDLKWQHAKLITVGPFVPSWKCICSVNLKVLPVAIHKLLAFDQIFYHFSWMTFDLEPVDSHPSKVVRHKFTWRLIIPENFKSLASAVQSLRLHKSLLRFVDLTFDPKWRHKQIINLHIFVPHIDMHILWKVEGPTYCHSEVIRFWLIWFFDL